MRLRLYTLLLGLAALPGLALAADKPAAPAAAAMAGTNVQTPTTKSAHKNAKSHKKAGSGAAAKKPAA